MSRYRAIYCHKTHRLLAEYLDDVLTWSADGGFEQDNCSGPQVIRDIGPYKSMLTGEIIDGRKRHRDHLKAYGCVEVGNESMTPTSNPVAKSTRKRLLHDILSDKSDRDMQRMVRDEIRNRRQ